MKKSITFCVFCFVLIFFTACAQTTPDPNQIEALVQERIALIATYTPYPTLVPYPTYTPLPTYTPAPTQTPHIVVVTATTSPTPIFTPTDTSTPTITPTFTNTPTFTPTPNTTKTAQAIANATKGADATATRQARNARATQVAQYPEADWKALLNYADDHIGEKVKIRAQVFNINSNTEFQMWNWNRDAVYIVMETPYSDIYERDWVTVYGVILGEHCGTNAFGGEVCQPLIMGDFYEKG
jgi:hypothetical protein